MDHDYFTPADAGGGRTAEPPAERLLDLVHWLSAASRNLRRKLADVAASCELSDSELLVVWLCRGTGLVQGELASAIGVSAAQMSGLVERLGRRGLVAMHRSARDRRRQVCKTASAGEILLAQAATPLAELAAAISCHATQHEQSLVRSLCQKLASAGLEPQQASQDEQPVCQEAA